MSFDWQTFATLMASGSAYRPDTRKLHTEVSWRLLTVG